MNVPKCFIPLSPQEFFNHYNWLFIKEQHILLFYLFMVMFIVVVIVILILSCQHRNWRWSRTPRVQHGLQTRLPYTMLYHHQILSHSCSPNYQSCTPGLNQEPHLSQHTPHTHTVKHMLSVSCLLLASLIVHWLLFWFWSNFWFPCLVLVCPTLLFADHLTLACILTLNVDYGFVLFAKINKALYTCPCICTCLSDSYIIILLHV